MDRYSILRISGALLCYYLIINLVGCAGTLPSLERTLVPCTTDANCATLNGGEY
jgi:hypothetical protein